MARFIDESFEGTGYEESWTEDVGSGSTIDEDSSGPGTLPGGGGSQCLRIVSSGNNALTTRNSGGYRATAYTRVYLYVSAISGIDALAEDVNIVQIKTEGGTNTASVVLYHDGTNVVFRFGYHISTGWQYFTGTAAVATGQWYRIEVGITAAGAVEARVNGATIGSATGVTLDRGEPYSWTLGTQWNAAGTATLYYDLLAVDDTTWVGAESSPAIDITAGAGALTLAGQSPSLGLGITPSAGTITVTGAAPTDIERGLRYSYPTADTTTGPWAASTGTDLYAMIDEEAASDTDYIYANATGTGKFKILPVTDPGASTGHVVNYRIWSPVAGNAKVRLVQGSTTVVEWTHTGLPTTATLYSQSLTGEQADAITDYDDLYLEFEAT